MISAERARVLRDRHDRYERAREQFDPKRFKRGGGYTPSDQAEIERIAGVKNVSNEERGELEEYEFAHSQPEKYFAYYDKALTNVHTWMGQVIGRIVWKGQVQRSMGGQRINVRIKAINGLMYAGSCNLTGGDYCTMRRMKG